MKVQKQDGLSAHRYGLTTAPALRVDGLRPPAGRTRQRLGPTPGGSLVAVQLSRRTRRRTGAVSDTGRRAGGSTRLGVGFLGLAAAGAGAGAGAGAVIATGTDTAAVGVASDLPKLPASSAKSE